MPPCRSGYRQAWQWAVPDIQHVVNCSKLPAVTTVKGLSLNQGARQAMDFVSRMKESGCATCAFAGTPTGSPISPKLTADQIAARDRSGADYYCPHFNRPVMSGEGTHCSAWKYDRVRKCRQCGQLDSVPVSTYGWVCLSCESTESF